MNAAPEYVGRRRVNPYPMVSRPGHPRANTAGCVYVHILVAEAALGRPLPDGAVVHHVNGDGWDNRPANLVVCEDHAYHMLLHRRLRALQATGDADARLCWICRRWDSEDQLYLHPNGRHAVHRACANARNRERRAARRAS